MIPSGQLRELLSKLFHDPREPLRTIQVSLELLQMRSERIADQGHDDGCPEKTSFSGTCQ